MRIMPLMQQNLNNRPCVQNNQPNFEGVFVRENPLILEKVFPKGSVGAKVLDVVEVLVNKYTAKHLRVTAEPMPAGEAEEILLMANNEVRVSAMTNLKLTAVENRPEVPGEGFQTTLRAYVGDKYGDVNNNANFLIQELTLPQFDFDWQGIAEALKTIKPQP